MIKTFLHIFGIWKKEYVLRDKVKLVASRVKVAMVWVGDRGHSRFDSTYQNDYLHIYIYIKKLVASHQKPGLNFIIWSCPWTNVAG